MYQVPLTHLNNPLSLPSDCLGVHCYRQKLGETLENLVLDGQGQGNIPNRCRESYDTEATGIIDGQIVSNIATCPTTIWVEVRCAGSKV
jgi:hypothetical protein